MDTEKKKPLQSLLLSFAVAVVLLTPLVVFVALRSNERRQGLLEEPAPEKTAVAAAAATKAPARAAIPILEAERAAAKAPRPSPMPKASQTAASPGRAFPAAKDIPIGIDKSWLLDSYGKPNMVTTEVTDGRALETFRYLKPESSTEVVVYLSSGKVVGASSSAY